MLGFAVILILVIIAISKMPERKKSEKQLML